MYVPFVSVLLVVRNEKDHLRACLNSLAEQDYPREALEFVFVDGCSHDGTYALLEQEVERLTGLGCGARLLRNNRQILASGWNLGIRAARGEYVCRIDGHSTIGPSYISTGVRCLQEAGNTQVAAVGGWLDHAATTPMGQLIAILLSSRFAVGDSPFRRKPCGVTNVDTAVYAIYRRSVFAQVGYFDETLARNQDMVLHARVKAAGNTFLMHPDMKIRYYVRSTVGRLLRKAFGDGQWVALAGSGHFGPRHKIPSLFVACLGAFLLTITVACIVPKSMILPIIAASLAAPLAAYLVLSVVAAMKTQSGSATRLLLPPLFFAFHVAYGVGTLWGHCRVLCRRLRRSAAAQSIQQFPLDRSVGDDTRLIEPERSRRQ